MAFQKPGKAGIGNVSPGMTPQQLRKLAGGVTTEMATSKARSKRGAQTAKRPRNNVKGVF